MIDTRQLFVKADTVWIQQLDPWWIQTPWGHLIDIPHNGVDRCYCLNCSLDRHTKSNGLCTPERGFLPTAAQADQGQGEDEAAD